MLSPTQYSTLYDLVKDALKKEKEAKDAYEKTLEFTRDKVPYGHNDYIDELEGIIPHLQAGQIEG